MYTACTREFKGIMRQVDTVMIKGVKQPVDIFTVSIEPQLMKPERFLYEYMNLHESKEKLVEKM